MDRARFDSELAELLADPDAPDRQARVAAMLRHCDEHPGGRELAELLRRPPGRRDPIPDPGADYWERFGARVRDRVRSSERSRRQGGVLAVAAVAAALALAVGMWLFAPDASPPVAKGLDPGASSVPEELVRVLVDAEPDAPPALDLVTGIEDTDWLDAGEDLDPLPDALPGAEAADADGWMFPETYGLDADGRRALIEWVREQEARTRGDRV